MSIKEGGKGIVNSKPTQKKNEEILMTAKRYKTANTRINRATIARKQKSEEKEVYEYFK